MKTSYASKKKNRSVRKSQQKKSRMKFRQIGVKSGDVKPFRKIDTEWSRDLIEFKKALYCSLLDYTVPVNRERANVRRENFEGPLRSAMFGKVLCWGN